MVDFQPYIGIVAVALCVLLMLAPIIPTGDDR